MPRSFSTTHRSSRRQAHAILVALAALLAALALAGCGKKVETKAAEEAKPKVDEKAATVEFTTNAPQLSSIVVQTAEPRTNAITYATGRLYWNDETTVRVFTPVMGRVTSLKLDLGAAVTAGMPLAEIDSPDFAQALADARTAVGNLMAADKAYTRAKALLEHGAGAAKDVDAAHAAFVAARAERDRSAARLANYGGGEVPAADLNDPEPGGEHYTAAKTTRGPYILRSPLDGVLVEKNINPGQEVRPDQMLANYSSVVAPLFVISDPSKLWLQIDVAETDLPVLQTGLKLRVISKAFPDQSFEGVVDKIGASLDPATRTVKVRGVVNNPDKLLKAEMYVLVDVVQDVSKLDGAGVEIPSRALFMKGEDSYLFLETERGHFLRKQVKVGVEKNNRVPVFEGVTAGQKVVVEGALLLQSLVEPAG